MKNSSVKKILVVEDETAISDVCRRVLTGEGFEVDIAVNGKVAQNMIIGGKHYDLYLIDIRTPEMNGVELYQWLEEKYPVVTNRVILTSGSVMGGDTMAFVEQSGRAFLPKPFTPAELRAIMKESLTEVVK